MKKELEHFRVEGAYGSRQDWFPDWWMRIGGCAAITACESSIYFDLYRGTQLCPCSGREIRKKDFLEFGMKMKPYLRPRWGGVDRLELYIDGYRQFLSDRGCGAVSMQGLAGTEDVQKARSALVDRIDQGVPVPFLLLKHTNPVFRDYEWHWFLLNGYETRNDRLMVKAATYGNWRWFSFDAMWDTGFAKKGGLILYNFACE